MNRRVVLFAFIAVVPGLVAIASPADATNASRKPKVPEACSRALEQAELAVQALSTAVLAQNDAISAYAAPLPSVGSVPDLQAAIQTRAGNVQTKLQSAVTASQAGAQAVIDYRAAANLCRATTH